MADRLQLARPMMRGRTRFNADETRRKLLEERQDMTALELTANDHTPGCVDAMDLKDRLRDVETDRRNPLHACSSGSRPPQRRPSVPLT